MSADLAVIVNDPSAIERSADPGQFLLEACERAKTWLQEALEHGEIDAIAEMKSQAEAIRVYTMSKQMGKDAQLAATEIVRRAERGIGLTIRRGQAEGKVRKAGQGSGPRSDYVRSGRTVHVDPLPGENLISPADFLPSGGTMNETYAMTDGVSDGDFESALADAKADGNLSRTNVIRRIREGRKASREGIPDRDDRTMAGASRRRELIRDMAAQGFSSRQMEQRLGTHDGTIRQIAREMGIEISADEVIAKTRRHDSNRIVRETVHALEGLAMGIGLIEPDDLDPAEAANWAASLTDSIRVLNRLIKTLKETAQ